MKSLFVSAGAAPRVMALCMLVGPLAACMSGERSTPVASLPVDSRFADLPEGGSYKVGKPYQIEGVWYYPSEDFSYVEEGIASWYGPDFHGKRTANGERYDMNALTAAHPTLPMPSIVKVTNLDNGRTLNLRINDRGPFKSKRIIDISRQGAQLLGFKEAGTARVRVEIDRDESMTIKNQFLARSPGEMPQIASAPRASISTQALSPPTVAASAPPPRPTTVARAPSPAAANAPAPQRADPGKGKIDLPAGTGVYIQAGAFSEPANAQRLEQQLRDFGNVFVVTVTINGKQLYRVRLGPLQDDTGADQLLGQIKSYGYADAQIVRF